MIFKIDRSQDKLKVDRKKLTVFLSSRLSSYDMPYYIKAFKDSHRVFIRNTFPPLEKMEKRKFGNMTVLIGKTSGRIHKFVVNRSELKNLKAADFSELVKNLPARQKKLMAINLELAEKLPVSRNFA